VLVYGDARLVQPEIAGVRLAPNRQQNVRAGDVHEAIGTIRMRDDLFAAFGKADALRVEAHVYAFPFQDLLDGRGHILVFASYQALPHFDDRDLASETAIHLPELEPNIAAADNDEMRGEIVYFHHGAVVETLNLRKPRHLRAHGPPANIDEDLRCAQAIR